MNVMGLYAMRLAKEARRKCEQNKLIDKNQVILELIELKNIINFFGGELKDNNINKYKLEIHKMPYSFVLHYPKDNIDPYIVLKNLGKLCLTVGKFKDNDINICNELAIVEPEAGVFAREFLMPGDLFETNYLENSKLISEGDADINFDEIAKTFGVESLQVIARG